MTAVTNTNIMTPEFRVSYPWLFTPQPPMAGSVNKDPKYSIVMLFPKGADISKLKAAAEAAVIGKWGSDKTKWPKNLRTPFRDQGEKESEGYVAGAIFVTATSKQKPGVVGPDVQPIIDNSEIYAGCWGRATLRAYAYDNAGNKGVAFGLQNFQKLRDGDSLSGRVKAEQEFEPIAAAVNEADGAGGIFG
jgi:hypothetical protein